MKTLIAVLALALTACATTPQSSVPAPFASKTQGFYPISRAFESTEGYLEANQSKAAFSLRKGSMHLKFAETQPQPADKSSWFALDSTVPPIFFYKITNADSYFAANKSGNGMGPQPATWLAVAHTNQGGISLCLGNGPMNLDPNLANIQGCSMYLNDMAYPDPTLKKQYQ